MNDMLRRVWAMLVKEFHQLRRDPVTFGLVVAMPLIQLSLFGFAINNDPRHLKAAIETNDSSTYTRTIQSALRNSTYFDLIPVTRPGEGEEMLRQGEVQFLIIIPPNFSRDLVRGDRPQLLVLADATDPASTGNAISAVEQSVLSGLRHDLIGPTAARAPPPSPVDVVIQRRYNPEGITSHNIVPGLLAVVLSMTMVTMTSISVARERERGTMENLLATPLRPMEVMAGKILPFVAIGALQTVIIIAVALIVFGVPFQGPAWALGVGTLVFVTVSLLLGFTLSTFADSQMQAMQMSFFYILPSILLSGFAFPFAGMPTWAQWLGETLPVTHFLRVVRGVMLKGWGFGDTLPQLGVLIVMGVLLALLAAHRYGDTLE
ncbi:ABC transporter permease [Stakelama tenebrarum]|uniref:ABC transporter permease n=1 Tax=Stakelama tenebrarum TaxID=2711215 RepID=A0A6G6Y6C2_9SPHN|nr:ABC transporter permease [Sphingosinithalassobacter tenebrarum]QIG80482.1 ABC transporter permease [Sphingosinithalassobacter tenebrarum]